MSTAAPSQVSSQEQPNAGDITAAVFVGLLILFTIVGNLLVCVSFYMVEELHTLCNYFVVSLGVADILVALLAMPFWCALQITRNQWTLGPTLRAFWDCIDILCGTASIMNLTAVSIDRHYAITMPFGYPNIMSSKRALLMIAAAWVYAALVSSLRLFDWNNRSAYMHFVVCASFLLPLVIMLVMYLRIYAVARKQVERIGRSFATDIKATKTIAVVVGAFVICWTPFFVVIIGFSVTPSFGVPGSALKLIKWLTYMNSCLNPVIYTCLNRTYRRAFQKLFVRFVRVRRDRADSSLSRHTVRSSLTCETAMEVRRSKRSNSIAADCMGLKDSRV